MRRPSEDELIARYLAPLAGPGAFGLRDDAALATPRAGHDLVVTKDMLIADVHFFADDPPESIARKALRVNLSDLAAKAAEPKGFLLGLALPTDWTESWLACFAAALGEDAAHFGCPLLGGDTVATGGPLVLSVTAVGEVPAGGMVPRTGVRPGDLVYVSGTIGDAALGLKVRRDSPIDAAWLVGLAEDAAGALLSRYRTPEPRLALRDALRAHARAAMDVSDGLIGDLGKLLRLEGLTTTVAAADVPLSDAARAAIDLEPGLLHAALTGGDDYEILCAVAPAAAAPFVAKAGDAGVPLRRIASAVRGDEEIAVRDATGARLAVPGAGFRHFT